MFSLHKNKRGSREDKVYKNPKTGKNKNITMNNKETKLAIATSSVFYVPSIVSNKCICWIRNVKAKKC